jgi:FkbM family methyltransferase
VTAGSSLASSAPAAPCVGGDTVPDVTLSLARPLEPQLADLRRAFGPGAEVIAALEETPFRFRCRVHGSDIPVVFDTFAGLYHLPPVPPPERPVIVDLGANIGCTIVHYASLYPGARIVGVELDAENVRLARINTSAIADTATVLHAAIWPHDGNVGYSGGEAWGYRVESGGETTVAALSMPSLMKSCGLSTIDFLKVDIEGAERDLFQGTLPWLQHVRSLAIEVHDDEALIGQLISLLTARGFVAQRDTHHWSAVIAARVRG